jgi:hypothetical protein
LWLARPADGLFGAGTSGSGLGQRRRSCQRELPLSRRCPCSSVAAGLCGIRAVGVVRALSRSGLDHPGAGADVLVGCDLGPVVSWTQAVSRSQRPAKVEVAIGSSVELSPLMVLTLPTYAVIEAIASVGHMDQVAEVGDVRRDCLHRRDGGRQRSRSPMATNGRVAHDILAVAGSDAYQQQREDAGVHEARAF